MGEVITSSGYQAALDYILSFADYERSPRSSLVLDLKRIEELLTRLGEPQRAARSIHIAGTKGKGSTAAMIATALASAGYRTGLYTSPHLHILRERIEIDGRPIAEEELTRLVGQLKPEIEAINHFGGLGELTTFEILTALAFAYFRAKQVDFQVLEAGLGGRLDATNVVEPEVCAITSLSLDHVEVLGDTLAKIAREKAGIIKPGSVVVTAPQPPEAASVIEKICLEKRARLIRVGYDVAWRRKSFDLSGQIFQVKGMMGEHDLFIPLLGEHQLENATVAVAVLEILMEKGAKIPPQSVTAGLAQVKWPGRLQVLQCQPLLVVDGAHNAYSAGKLKEALKEYFDFQRLILVVGMSWDKDIAGMVAEFASFSNTVIVTRSKHPRAAETLKLMVEFSKRGIIPSVAEDVASALEQALRIARPRDLICVAGSLFIVAEAIEYGSRMAGPASLNLQPPDSHHPALLSTNSDIA
jgi:dihydrofolate synthase/folylpolyglutamate synthase